MLGAVEKSEDFSAGRSSTHCFFRVGDYLASENVLQLERIYFRFGAAAGSSQIGE